MRLMSASPKSVFFLANLPSKTLRSSFSGRVSRTRAAFLQELGSEYLPELGESELGSPDLFLASKTVGSDESQSKETRTS